MFNTVSIGILAVFSIGTVQGVKMEDNSPSKGPSLEEISQVQDLSKSKSHDTQVTNSFRDFLGLFRTSNVFGQARSKINSQEEIQKKIQEEIQDEVSQEEISFDASKKQLKNCQRLMRTDDTEANNYEKQKGLGKLDTPDHEISLVEELSADYSGAKMSVSKLDGEDVVLKSGSKQEMDMHFELWKAMQGAKHAHVVKPLGYCEDENGKHIMVMEKLNINQQKCYQLASRDFEDEKDQNVVVEAMLEFFKRVIGVNISDWDHRIWKQTNEKTDWNIFCTNRKSGVTFYDFGQARSLHDENNETGENLVDKMFQNMFVTFFSEYKGEDKDLICQQKQKVAETLTADETFQKLDDPTRRNSSTKVKERLKNWILPCTK